MAYLYIVLELSYVYWLGLQVAAVEEEERNWMCNCKKKLILATRGENSVCRNQNHYILLGRLWTDSSYNVVAGWSYILSYTYAKYNTILYPYIVMPRFD